MTTTRYRVRSSTKPKKRKTLKPWSRVFGTVYGIKGEHPKRQRVRTVYVGMTAQVPWTKRISQHLYGSKDSPPKLWADTVPGYAGGIHSVVAEGGCFIIWQKPCFYGYLKLRESWTFIWYRPCYNILENTHRSSHIPKWEAEQQRADRDARRQQIEQFGAVMPHRFLKFLNPKIDWRIKRNGDGELEKVS